MRVQINAQTQHGPIVDQLGMITYNFNEGLLMVTETRRAALTFEIVNILSRGSLSPAAAAKLRGRLGFVASHLFGRHGRRVLLALSERQYSRSGSCDLTDPLRQALRMWLLLLHKNATPRLLYGCPDQNLQICSSSPTASFLTQDLRFRKSGVHRG